MRNERGASLLETVVILPLLLILAVGATEVIRMASVYKVAVQLSREAASIAFRDCIAVGDPANPQDLALLQACLTERAAILLQYSGMYGRAGTEVILGYYQVVDTIAGPQVQSWGTVGAQEFQPIINEDSLRAKLYQLIGDRVVVAEVFVPHSAVVESLGSWFNFNATHVYDATIL